MTRSDPDGYIAQRMLPAWQTVAVVAEGYTVVHLPGIGVPAHDVVIERWDGVFVAGSPDINATLPGYGRTPLEAMREHERKNFWPQDLMAFTPHKSPRLDGSRRRATHGRLDLVLRQLVAP